MLGQPKLPQPLSCQEVAQGHWLGPAGTLRTLVQTPAPARRAHGRPGGLSQTLGSSACSNVLHAGPEAAPGTSLPGATQTLLSPGPAPAGRPALSSGWRPLCMAVSLGCTHRVAPLWPGQTPPEAVVTSSACQPPGGLQLSAKFASGDSSGWGQQTLVPVWPATRESHALGWPLNPWPVSLSSKGPRPPTSPSV